MSDIFQIVSLSRRSGVLKLTTPFGEGEIIFDGGRVVGVANSGAERSIGDELLERGILNPNTYQEMLAAEGNGAQGKDVFSGTDVDMATIESEMESILKDTIYSMFSWDEGSFNFVLGENVDPWQTFSLKRNLSIAISGINPQFLAIEGARLRDELCNQDSLEKFLALEKNQSGPAIPDRSDDVKTIASQLRQNTMASPPPVTKPITTPPIVSSSTSISQESTTSLVTNAATSTDAKTITIEDSTSHEGPKTEKIVIPITQNKNTIEDEPVESEQSVQPTPSIPIPPPLPTARKKPITATNLILMGVDDDLLVTKQLQKSFGSQFTQSIMVNSVADALKKLDELDLSRVVVVSDLIIARSDGTGILGGIEILEKVRERTPDLPVILFSDYENVEAEERAKKLGVEAFLMKPRKAQIQTREKNTVSEAMQAFIDTLAEKLDVLKENAEVLPIEEIEQPSIENASKTNDKSSENQISIPPAADLAKMEREDTIDLRKAIVSYVDELEVPGSEEFMPDIPSSGSMNTLRSMLAELIDPANRETVTLLVLRFASQLLERASLFLVTKQAYVGLGGFSAEETSEQFANRIRKIKISKDADSVFNKVVKFRAAVRAKLAQADGNNVLVQGMGGSWPQGIVVAMPLISNDKVAAILYGDNPSGQELGPTDTLEIFFQQAGLTMDRVLLERKLNELRKQQESEN